MIAVSWENVIIGSIAAAGAGIYCWHGYLKAKDAARKTPEKERLSWTKVGLTVLPSLGAGFLAGYAMDPSAVEITAAFLAGMGAAHTGAVLGINSYFDTDEEK